MKKFLFLSALSMLISVSAHATATTTAPATPAATATTQTTTTTTAAPAATPAPAATDAAATTTTTTTTTTTEGTSNEQSEEKKTEENPLENTLYLDLKDGRVVIQLRPDLAPNHVKRVKELVRQNFYDNVPFHRVIDGFMAQTGDPTGTGAGGSGTKIDAEFSSEKHVRGTVSMARAADPNSADSQFFIMFDEAPHLDGNYTVFGQVIEGMEFVDKIKKGNGPNGMVSDPDKVVKLRVAADEDSKPAAAPATEGTVTTAPAAATPAATEAAKQ